MPESTDSEIKTDSQLFQSLFNGTPLGVIIVDSSFTIEDCNPQARRILRIKDGSFFVGEKLDSLFFEDRQLLTAAEKQRLRTGKSMAIHKELRFIKSEEEFFWASVHISAVLYPRKSRGRRIIHRYIIQFEDLTKQKGTELALEQSREQFQLLYDNMIIPALYLSISYDKKEEPNDLLLLDCNRASISSMGLRKERILGKKYSEVFGGIEKDILKMCVEAAETGIPHRKTVRSLLVNRTFNVSVYSFETGKVALLMDDVSDMEAMQMVLNQSENRFRSIYEESSVGILIFNEERSLILYNPACINIFGLLDDVSILGLSIEELFVLGQEVDISAFPREKADFEWIYDFNKVHESNLFLTRFNGKKWFHITVVPMDLGQPEGEISGFLVQIQDISSSKRLQDELIQAKEKAEESDRLKSAFLANMSHEIRTPLNAILGFSNLLGLASEEEKKNQYLNIIKDNSSQLLAIISDILDFSKIEDGQIEIINSMVNLNDLFDMMKRKHMANNTNPKMKILCKKGSPHKKIYIYTDPNRLKQVLDNLIGNALKFTKQGTVTFGYIVNKDSIEFYVSDTGIGIKPDDLDLIFHRFRQASDTTVTKKLFSGAGLGLAISQALVHLLGGQISVESEEGKGSRFSFSLLNELKGNI